MNWPRRLSPLSTRLAGPRDAAALSYFEWVWNSSAPARTLATRIMDTADDIAYAAHDFEDGVWARMIPLFELLNGNATTIQLLKGKVYERDRIRLFRRGDFERTLEHLLASPLLAYLRQGPYDGSREARASLKDFTARLIHDFVHEASAGGKFVEPAGDTLRRMNVLKAMAWQWMIERPDITTHQFGQRKVVEELFDGYWTDPLMLPRREEWQLISDERSRGVRRRKPLKARFIRDHIAGMTDGYAREAHAQMHRGRQERELRHAY